MFEFTPLEAITLTFVLLVIYQAKHFICDFVLQIGNEYMLRKFNKVDWILPLASHSGIHAAFTMLITKMAFAWAIFMGSQISVYVGVLTVFLLTVADFIIHFTMDRIKASPNMLGRYKDMMNKGFWYSLALDQAVHHLTHYFIIYVVVMVALG